MTKVKVGDRVEVIECLFKDSRHIGEMGRVVKIQGGGIYKVNFITHCLATKVHKLKPKRRKNGK